MPPRAPRPDEANPLRKVADADRLAGSIHLGAGRFYQIRPFLLLAVHELRERFWRHGFGLEILLGVVRQVLAERGVMAWLETVPTSMV
jgi:hypothetical protein